MLGIDLQRCVWNRLCVSDACYHVKSSGPDAAGKRGLLD
jgi:hypothetical protein